MDSLDQLILPGTMTLRDVLRERCREIGAKGGRSRSEAKRQAGRKNVKKATAARMAKRRKPLMA
jgi:hypothetical protein